ncbi:unnamed protein product [Amoebophrya sp. A120]|nr:unnamed protein product [Amoebophrya sp. A120]|eukprot:GSA120T00002899001.1
MFSGKFFRGMKESLFGVPKRSSTFDSERGQLSDYDRFISTVLSTTQDFQMSFQKLATLHDNLFQLCDSLYPVGLPARNHVVSIKDLLEIFAQRYQKAEEVLSRIRDVAGQASQRNQVIFGSLDSMDRLTSLLDHYEEKLRKLRDQLQNAQRDNNHRLVESLTTKIIRNEGKRNGHKQNLDKITRDVNFDIHEIIENRINSASHLIAELAELYSVAFSDLQNVLDLLREQSALLRIKGAGRDSTASSPAARPAAPGDQGSSGSPNFQPAARSPVQQAGMRPAGSVPPPVGFGSDSYMNNRSNYSPQGQAGPGFGGGPAPSSGVPPPAASAVQPPTAYSNLNPPPQQPGGGGAAGSSSAPPYYGAAGRAANLGSSSSSYAGPPSSSDYYANVDAYNPPAPPQYGAPPSQQLNYSRPPAAGNGQFAAPPPMPGPAPRGDSNAASSRGMGSYSIQPPPETPQTRAGGGTPQLLPGAEGDTSVTRKKKKKREEEEDWGGF